MQQVRLAFGKCNCFHADGRCFLLLVDGSPIQHIFGQVDEKGDKAEHSNEQQHFQLHGYFFVGCLATKCPLRLSFLYFGITQPKCRYYNINYI